LKLWGNGLVLRQKKEAAADAVDDPNSLNFGIQALASISKSPLDFHLSAMTSDGPVCGTLAPK
jgi:hypothetical protein